MATKMRTKMDQETAQVLFKEGAILLFLDVPEGTEFGIDYNSWRVGPKFRGVKMIPPGLHFVYYSACNSEGDTAPRTGFFYHFKQREIVVRKWDKYNEDIKTDVVPEDEIERYRGNLEDIDAYLGPYPYSNYKKWVSMSDHMTWDLVQRLQPENVTICSVTQFVSERSNSKSRKEAAENQMVTNTDPRADNSQSASEAKLPKLDTIPGTEIRFSKISSRRYPEGSTPAEITKHSMDSSYALNTLINSYYKNNEKDLLGEIQFAFICFIIGQVFDAFDQWKKLVHLLCTSEEALSNQVDFYMDFIGVLHFQVREIPQDFFVDIVSANNFLTTTLQRFFSNLEHNNVNIDKRLRERGIKFRDHLTQKFKWDFTSEPEEDGPVIVDLDEC